MLLAKGNVHNRLVFIDIARSIAILMMLEGHFIVMALTENHRGNDLLLYDIWRFTRGLTAPLFFTVSGLVFTYLLVRKKEPFFKNKRVKKGLNRGLKLILWGYALQLNLYFIFKGVIENGSYTFSGYMYIFHVLQCIGASLITVILLYGLNRLIKVVPLTWWFGICGTLVFILRPTIYALDFSAFHPLIENIFVSTSREVAFKSIFPLFPWVGFVIFGAMIGAYVSKNPDKVYTNKFPLMLFITGLVLNLFSDNILKIIQPALLNISGIKPFYGLGYLFARFGQVIWVLAVIIFLGKHKRYLRIVYHRKLAFLKSWIIPITFGISGLTIIFYTLLSGNEFTILPTFSLYALGHLFLFISVIIITAKLVNWNYNLFIKVGQNTLSIYIVHVIILYNGLFGFGLSTYLDKNLTPWFSIIGAIGFIMTFVYFVKYIEVFQKYYDKLFFWKKRN
ncbi:heparan-alpha-glucosaminide N-acetyltransferase domain-containing protein [Brumimicrobium mesophilum]|uniref:heparan-alpha-glucosaminide N-acetyltransferase domain-containing protein n=1 Tax=Brumimicrobium mesophilum TaxID=392717 RepID=UPI000D1405EC|nr:heparan-alpha-glucosaminide N-acetyltransferase domain-containing protein [Brumimicrobium mesophilum]